MSALDELLNKVAKFCACGAICETCAPMVTKLNAARAELNKLRDDHDLPTKMGPVTLPPVLQIDTMSGKVMDEDGAVIAIVRDTFMTLNVERHLAGFPTRWECKMQLSFVEVTP